MFKKSFPILISLLLMAWGASGEVRLPVVFSDHMVVQQNTGLKIWGWADLGETVEVRLGDSKVATSANAAGKWQVLLKPPPAGGPYEMVVVGETNTITVNDVLVGEVWLCGGETNMEWPVSRSGNAEQEIANADHPQLRLFRVKHATADEPLEDCVGEWKVCTSENVPGFSAAAYYFGRALQAELKVPVGLLQMTWSGVQAEAWMPLETLAALETAGPLLARWEKAVQDWPAAKEEYDMRRKMYDGRTEALAQIDMTQMDESVQVPAMLAPGPRPVLPTSPKDPRRPATLYNAMLSPISGYSIQGAVLYQGEASADRAYQYRELFPAMISDWRQAWGGRVFPTIFVQLASYGERREKPRESAWAELREAQRMTLALENTAMVTAIDIGDPEDLHPANKQEVGRRLSRGALALAYGKEVLYSGPVYESMKVEGKEIRVTFAHTDDGLHALDGALKGFEVAGEDQIFVWADARIEGNDVVVSSEVVNAPIAARYAWARNPDCNLIDGAGFPASPFRTDAWYGLTISAR